MNRRARVSERRIRHLLSHAAFTWWRRLVPVVASFGVLALVVGVTGAVPASVVSASYTYDSAAYAYDAPTPLSSPDTAPKLARRCPPGPVSVLWVSPASVRDGVVAAKAAPEVAGVATGGVYTLRDEVGNVVRTGRSKDLAARQAQHANDSVLGGFEFKVEYRTDVYAEQRGLEGVLYDRYPGARAANGGYNEIGAISPSNPNLGTYQQATADYLARMAGGG